MTHRPLACHDTSVARRVAMPPFDPENLPHHVGIIMDGNGRWATQRGQLRPWGHREGSQAVRRIVRASRRIGLGALTLYAFSYQNWSRSEIEVQALMALLEEYLVKERAELLDNGIQLRAIGEIERLPDGVRQVLDALCEETAAQACEMTLTLALSYGGQEEIVAAVRRLASRVAAGTLAPEAIDLERLAAEIPSEQLGSPDLIIRTGGEMRLSNFLLFGSAYAELYFSDRLWPDFSEDDLFAAIACFQGRERRFGRADGSPTESDVEPFAPRRSSG